MICPGVNEKPPSYKSYKAEKFHKNLERMRALVRGVHDLSLRDEDKRQLLKEMKDCF